MAQEDGCKAVGWIMAQGGRSVQVAGGRSQSLS